MRIILYRHAPAERRDLQRWPDDLSRPLSARGGERAVRVARALVRLEPKLACVLASPARRAHDTALALAEATGRPVGVETLAALAPGGSWRDVLRALSHRDGNEVVALVGHEPDLGKLAGVLLFGAPKGMPFKKAGAASIDVEAPAAGRGRLRWWCPPGAMRALARKKRSRT